MYDTHFLRNDFTLSERVKRREETPTVHTILLFHLTLNKKLFFKNYRIWLW